MVAEMPKNDPRNHAATMPQPGKNDERATMRNHRATTIK
jgi:hypothetical protein